MFGDPPSSHAPSSVIIPTDAPTIGYGRYVLLSKLAEGGMASVYKAWDHKLRVWRAIKILNADYARRAVLRGRFETEAKTMARIDDPNVIQVYDVGTREALPYMVMELAEGGTVNHWLETYGTMPARMAVSVTLQSARGLYAAHQLGVVHRDVKPHNLLVTADAQVKVADFGIARVLIEEGEDVTRTGAAMGTIGYMAPEQKVDARSVDARADIYGLGAMLYKLVYGRIVSDLFLVEHRPGLLDGLPEALRPIVLTACFHDRDRRYADAPSMMRALREALPHLPEMPPDTPSLVMPMLASMRDYTAGFPELAPLIGTERRSSPVPLPYTMPRPVRRISDESDDAPSYVISSPPTPRTIPPPPPFHPGGRAHPTAAPTASGIRGPLTPPDARPPDPRSAAHQHTIVPYGPADRATDAADASGAAPRAQLALMLLGACAGLVLVSVVGLGAIGAYTMRERQEVLEDARTALYAAAEHERSVLQDLASRGARPTDLARLADLYDRFLSTNTEPTRSEAAEAYLTELRRVSADVLSGASEGSMALAKIRNLERAWNLYESAETRFESAHSGIPGRLAAATGLH